MIINQIVSYQLEEGIHDPHIFKAIIMGGGPGSGKTSISKRIQGGTGLKRIDSDVFHEIDIIKSKDPNFERYTELFQSQFNMYAQGKLGIIIDTTSNTLNKVEKYKTSLEKIGYDVLFVYVNAKEHVAQARVENRAKLTGRTVDINYFHQVYNRLKNNLGLLQNLFHENFLIIDNDKATVDMSYANKVIHRFINSPVHNHIGRKYIEQDRTREIPNAKS